MIIVLYSYFTKSDSKQVLRAYKLPVLIGFPEMMEQIKPDKDQEDQTISGAEIMERYSKTHPEFKDCTFKYIEHTNTIIPLKEKAVYVPDICMIQLPITVATGGYHIQFSADDFHRYCEELAIFSHGSIDMKKANSSFSDGMKMKLMLAGVMARKTDLLCWMSRHRRLIR